MNFLCGNMSGGVPRRDIRSLCGALFILSLSASGFAADGPAMIALKNPRMTEGGAKPEHWTGEWTGKGKIQVSRDTATFHSAPASLALSAAEGPAQGQVSQFFDVRGGQTVRLSGWLRADGGANAMLAIQSFTADWKSLELKVLGNALPGVDWRKAEGEVTLPASAARAAAVLMIQGNGTAWLDDVSADGSDPGADAQPKSVAMRVEPKPQGPPKARNACDPAEGFWPDYPAAWRQTLNGQIKRAQEGNAPLVFIGDSLTQGWSEQSRWKEHYAKLGAANFGVGGDGTPQVLWRIEKGILDGLNPKVVVLCIGINNVWPGFGAEDTIKGIEAVLARIKEKCPESKILLLGNTHFHDKGDGKSRARVRTINAALAKMADGRTVRFLDFGAQFLGENDALKPELYAGDKLHLSAKGYERWAAAMDPLLEALMQ